MSLSVSSLQAMAWDLCNAGYDEADPHVYRAVARELYQADVSSRIATLLAELDRQNAHIDALLTLRASSGAADTEAAPATVAVVRPIETRLPATWLPGHFPQA